MSDNQKFYIYFHLANVCVAINYYHSLIDNIQLLHDHVEKNKYYLREKRKYKKLISILIDIKKNYEWLLGVTSC